jgi:hypothetical protein
MNRISQSFLRFAFAISISLLGICAFAQDYNLFYQTFDDYQDNISIEDYVIVPNSYRVDFNKESFKVKTESGINKTRTVDFPSNFYTYEYKLLRRYEGYSYWLLAHGNYCFYIFYGNNEEWAFSEGITGKLIPFDNKLIPFRNKLFEEILDQNNLLAKYKGDNAQLPSLDEFPKDEYMTKSTYQGILKTIKYVRLLNELEEEEEEKELK